jgi:hypothetical protein
METAASLRGGCLAGDRCAASVGVLAQGEAPPRRQGLDRNTSADAADAHPAVAGDDADGVTADLLDELGSVEDLVVGMPSMIDGVAEDFQGDTFSDL